MTSKKLTLGSLFDGSGGFPLAGVLCGIEPVWASEIEPYPIKVTKARFPEMQHFGDITKLDGRDLPPVDIISLGSPCQDLSMAGRREGLHEGKRSYLFFEGIRIIEEMREATDGKYPKFAVWENVPGAFSSNGGGETSKPSCSPSATSKTPQLMCLDLRSGGLQDLWWETTTLSPGEYMMLNTGASPNVERGYTLSSIFEDKVPGRYYLSPKAAAGILRRNAKRGKPLPPTLEKALKKAVQAGSEEPGATHDS